MFSHRPEHLPGPEIMRRWLLMSFNGGVINAGGFLATGRFVSHVTGFATLFGVDLVQRSWTAALGIFSVPAFFLFGSFLAGWWIERPRYQGSRPRFDRVMLFCSICLLIPVLADILNHIPNFGTTFQLKDSYPLLTMLCLASGLQNGAFSAATQGAYRTTHLTGATTDLGLGISRLFVLDRTSTAFHRERKLAAFRLGTISAFIVGSAVGAILFYKFHYLGFLLPASIALFAAVEGRKIAS